MVNIPWRVECPVCLDFYKIPTDKKDDYVTLPCRHGACRNCLAAVYSRARRPNEADCPTCRKTFQRHEAHQLFLTFERSAITFASTTAEKMGEMDADSQLISVRTAGERVKKASEELKCEDDEVATSLLQAVEDFKTRIVPVFEERSTLEEENATLQRELQEAKREVARLRLLASEGRQKDNKIAEMKREATELRQLRADALSVSRGVCEDLKRLQADKDKLILEEKESKAEISRLKGMLEGHARTNRTQRVRIKALKEENTLLQAEVQAQRNNELEESLVFDDGQQEVVLQETQAVAGLRTPSPSPPSPTFPSSSPIHNDKENAQSRSTSSIGLPPLGFRSDWSMGGGGGGGSGSNPLKRKLSTTDGRTIPTVGVGITLDRKGHPIGSVQLGPKRSRRAV
ncbi:hypothetical protein V5O48_005747 [Marasmius crinis-equi]|uniref:RING-type domain-containing protein n=1 Tax=Marasmius crinis-equi TaxID=585013 RepID=A0ABR3FLU9_9AGAR